MHDALAALVPHRAIRSRALLACFGITAALHTATVLLNTLLPLHVTALDGTKTQVGLLFSVTTWLGRSSRRATGDRPRRHPVLRDVARVPFRRHAGRGDHADDRDRRRRQPHLDPRLRARGR